MFFKEDKNSDKKSIHIALMCVFLFWAIILFILSIFELVQVPIKISYLELLLAGLSVFFLSELIAKFIRRKQ